MFRTFISYFNFFLIFYIVFALSEPLLPPPSGISLVSAVTPPAVIADPEVDLIDLFVDHLPSESYLFHPTTDFTPTPPTFDPSTLLREDRLWRSTNNLLEFQQHDVIAVEGTRVSLGFLRFLSIPHTMTEVRVRAQVLCDEPAPAPPLAPALCRRYSTLHESEACLTDGGACEAAIYGTSQDSGVGSGGTDTLAVGFNIRTNDIFTAGQVYAVKVSVRVFSVDVNYNTDWIDVGRVITQSSTLVYLTGDTSYTPTSRLSYEPHSQNLQLSFLPIDEVVVHTEVVSSSTCTPYLASDARYLGHETAINYTVSPYSSVPGSLVVFINEEPDHVQEGCLVQVKFTFTDVKHAADRWLIGYSAIVPFMQARIRPSVQLVNDLLLPASKTSIGFFSLDTLTAGSCVPYYTWKVPDFMQVQQHPTDPSHFHYAHIPDTTGHTTNPDACATNTENHVISLEFRYRMECGELAATGTIMLPFVCIVTPEVVVYSALVNTEEIASNYSSDAEGHHFIGRMFAILSPLPLPMSLRVRHTFYDAQTDERLDDPAHPVVSTELDGVTNYIVTDLEPCTDANSPQTEPRQWLPNKIGSAFNCYYYKYNADDSDEEDANGHLKPNSLFEVSPSSKTTSDYVLSLKGSKEVKIGDLSYNFPINWISVSSFDVNYLPRNNFDEMVILRVNNGFETRKTYTDIISINSVLPLWHQHTRTDHDVIQLYSPAHTQNSRPNCTPTGMLVESNRYVAPAFFRPFGFSPHKLFGDVVEDVTVVVSTQLDLPRQPASTQHTYHGDHRFMEFEYPAYMSFSYDPTMVRNTLSCIVTKAPTFYWGEIIEINTLQYESNSYIDDLGHCPSDLTPDCLVSPDNTPAVGKTFAQTRFDGPPSPVTLRDSEPLEVKMLINNDTDNQYTKYTTPTTLDLKISFQTKYSRRYTGQDVVMQVVLSSPHLTDKELESALTRAAGSQCELLGVTLRLQIVAQSQFAGCLLALNQIPVPLLTLQFTQINVRLVETSEHPDTAIKYPELDQTPSTMVLAGKCPLHSYPCPDSTRCLAQAGFYMHKGVWPLQCPDGRYYCTGGASQPVECPTYMQPTANRTTCTTMPGYYLQTAGTFASIQVCDRGHYCPGDSLRYTCTNGLPNWEYQDEDRKTSCKICSKPELREHLVSYSSVTCSYCSDDHYLHKTESGSQCKLCEFDIYSQNFCAKYTDDSGVDVYVLETCPAFKYRTSDFSCVPCKNVDFTCNGTAEKPKWRFILTTNLTSISGIIIVSVILSLLVIILVCLTCSLKRKTAAAKTTELI